ncbi:diguanylate cyclase [Dyella solisilvae]|uniref:diguanylate cyclase n=1 Tax=Dyella solisilvae TaxID=1920168 RepID=A0A370KAS7_9GAMM|nr:GGDEF domain-containing protein [Dyella solisilvae]RDI99557.1 diguanylate cyclase [Dyella solisilvae]
MNFNSSASESINRRFRHIVLTFYGVVLLLLLLIIAEQWIGYRDARQAQREFVVLQAALQTMSNISGERLPMLYHLALGGYTTELDAARQATDASLAELDVGLNDPSCQTCASLAAPMTSVKATIHDARHELDAIGRLPRAQRIAEDAMRGFDRLVSVIPKLASMADTSATGVVRENADVQNYLLAARLAALLREHAGKLGGQFVPALVEHRALTADETFGIGQTLGKIEQLRMLIGPSLQGTPYALRKDFAELNQGYLSEGIAYIEQLRALASRPGGADVSPLELAAHYTPHIGLIIRFRDHDLSLADDEIRHSLRWHLALLLGTSALALTLSILLELQLQRFRKKIVQPFVEARRLILAIASGDLSVAVPEHRYAGEVNDLFGSVGVLKNISEEKVELEQERDRLIGELQIMAETDPLTGLLNRRAFESRAKVLLSDQRGGDAYAAVIMLDIDRFKRVNDTYGHETGDRVLVQLANLCRETCRSEDVVGRLGGEEFAILLRVRRPEQARELAQRLQQGLRQQTVVAASGESFGFTASFGVASAPLTHPIDIADLLRAADDLLYQAKNNGRDRIEEGALA